jgi:hypothetical protein
MVHIDLSEGQYKMQVMLSQMLVPALPFEYNSNCCRDLFATKFPVSPGRLTYGLFLECGIYKIIKIAYCSSKLTLDLLNSSGQVLSQDW